MPKKRKPTGSKKSVSAKKKITKKKIVKKKDIKEKVKVALDVKITEQQKAKLEKKPGSSNTGEYANVSPPNFAGVAGGASPYSFPINNIKRARSALSMAHFAPNPEGIQRAVYKQYPQLSPQNKKNKE